MVKVKRPQPQLAMGPCRFVNCGSAPKLRVQSYTRAYGQVLSDRELAQRAHFVTPSYQPLFPVAYSAPSKRKENLRLRSVLRKAANR